MNKSWSITIEKDYLKFSAAHFLIFPDGTAERLHGHNYKVFVEVHTQLDDHGLVINFKEIKPLIKELVDELDEHLLLPGQHPVLTCERRDDGTSEVRYQERRYMIPSDEIIVLPVTNTSAENLAGYLAETLLERMSQRFEGVRVESLRVGVEETEGQRGNVTLSDPYSA